MIKLIFSESQLGDIDEAIDSPEIGSRFQRKLLTLRLHNEGVQNQAIATVLRITPNTVTSYLKEYRDGELPKILEDRSYRPSSSLEKFLPCLQCFFTARPPATAAQAMHDIKKLTGITIGEEQARRTLHKLGMKCRKTAQIPGKADPQLQLEFFKDELQPRLNEAKEGLRKVYFVDAAHFVLGCFLGTLWSFGRIFVKGASGRQRYNVLGAVSSHSKEVVTLRSADNISAPSVIALIDMLQRKHPEESITLVMDNARYQRCKLVMNYAEEKGVELLFLPPYSPNLNLIERLWKLVRSKCLRNRYFPTFEDFRDALDMFFENINTTCEDELASMLSLNFQFFPTRNL